MNITVESAFPDGAGMIMPRPPATWTSDMVADLRVLPLVLRWFAPRITSKPPADKSALVTKQQATDGINRGQPEKPAEGPAHFSMLSVT
jgi:hypothetical protein